MIPQIGYNEFSQRLHGSVFTHRAPLDVTFEMTRRCPLTCLHCYNNLPMNDPARRNELTLDEYKRLFDEFAELGTLWLLFTGGEIFARPDFLDIYTEAKKRGFLITLFTNGTLINEKIADHLVEYKPFAIEITLYGHTRETYEKLTRIPGSYDRCHRGIQLLLERGLPLTLKTVGTTITKDEIYEMRAFAENLGLDFKFDSMMNPRIDCSQSPLDVRLTPEEVVELDLKDARRMPEWDQLFSRYRAALSNPLVSETVYSCGGGIASCAVSPYGEMTICVLSQVDRFDLRNGPAREGWEHFLREVRMLQRTQPVKCNSCEIRSMCSGCAAMSELEYGDKEVPVDFFCRTNHLRAYLLGLDLKPNPLCEYRPGSERYEEIQTSVAELRRKAEEYGHWTPPTTNGRSLPVFQTPPSPSDDFCNGFNRYAVAEG